MERIAKAGIACPVPFRVQPASWISHLGAPYGANATEASDTVLRVDKANGGDGVNFARVVTFLPGKVLVECAGKAPAVPGSGALRRVGAAVACVGAALHRDSNHCSSGNGDDSARSDGSEGAGSIALVYAPWNPAAAKRHLAWDLGNALTCERDLGFVDNLTRRELVQKWLRRFSRALQQDDNRPRVGAAGSHAGDEVDDEFAGLLAGLPEQIIHGDLNDYNILLTDEAALSSDDVEEITTAGTADCAASPDTSAVVAQRLCSGVSVLDFGDMVWSKRIYDLAIAVAYASQRRAAANDALSAALDVVHGYATAQRALYPTPCNSNGSSTNNGAHEDSLSTRGGGKLSQAEALALPVCVAARLCQSVLTSASTLAEIHASAIESVDSQGDGTTTDERVSAKKAELESRAAYVALSAAPGWALLQQWDELHDSGRLGVLVQALVE